MNNPFETIDARLSNLECLVLDLKHSRTTMPESDRWLSIEELCEYLPGHPAKVTIYGKVQRREIPHRKVGKRLVFSKKEIDQWLGVQGRRTASDLVGESGAYHPKRNGGKI
jgi:excisionase family DNA binding protein